MPAPPQLPESNAARADADALNAAYRTLHRCVLGLLAACALVAALGADADNATDVPPRDYTLAVIGLALGAVLSRRVATSPVINGATRARLSIASLALAGALGLVAATMALRHGALQSALVFTLAAGLFVLRPAKPTPDA